MQFKAFEKLSFLILLITAGMSYYNEGSLNIFLKCMDSNNFSVYIYFYLESIIVNLLI